MKKLLTFSIALTLCLYIGCAPRVQLPPDDIPSWDSPVPADYVPDISGALDAEKIPDILSEDDAPYNFRKTRWGFNPERVKLAEAKEGNRPNENTRELLVYRITINGVKCKLIYTFKDNKLRTAGYITITPIKNAENLIQTILDQHGMPMPELEHGMVWRGADSIVWTNAYATVIKETLPRYSYTDGGMLGDLLYKELDEREKAGEIVYFDGVIGYVDKAFYEALRKHERPLFELTLYEKQLMGILKRNGRTIIPSIGEIPN